VGKYDVDLSSLENFIGDIPFRHPVKRLVIIDEIGEMEYFSTVFTDLSSELLSSDKLVVATAASKGRV